MINVAKTHSSKKFKESMQHDSVGNGTGVCFILNHPNQDW